MSNQNPSNQTTGDSAAQSDASLTAIADSVSDLLSGVTVPAPIRKNAFKAFNQLCTAAIEIPIAYLEGVAAEKRAETQARIKIIATGAEQIAVQMNVDPEFARIAAKKYGQKIVREQVNLDRVSEVAAHQLQNDSLLLLENRKDNDNEIPPIDDDWLNSFEKEACQKSTEDMQLLFGRILAGEIRQPSSFSIRTVKLIGQLDGRAANLFRLLCSLAVSLRGQNAIIDARVLSLGGNAGSNALQGYGLNFDQLNVLQEYGLIISDYNSYANYSMCVAREGCVEFPFKYQNGDWVIVSATQQRPAGQELRLHGVALSRSGKELLKIVDAEPNDGYTAALNEFFQKQNLSMVKITRP